MISLLGSSRYQKKLLTMDIIRRHRNLVLLFLLLLGYFVQLSISSSSSKNDNDDDFPYLPPLLKFNNGSEIHHSSEWNNRRRHEIKLLLQKFLLGYLPEEGRHRSPIIKSRKINQTTYGVPSGSTSRFIEIVYDVHKGGVTSFLNITLEIISPQINIDSTDTPIFLTQWNHREWALVGVNRGYIGVVCPTADTRDVAPLFQAAFPSASMKLILSRAYALSHIIDYLLSPHASKDGIAIFNTKHISMTGHSRNGKQSLIAAAFDERITAVVGSSPGAPISSPYHFSSSAFYGEGPDAGQAGHWWTPDIIHYTAHPERLGMDGHGVTALIAPRACAIAYGWSDREGDLTFADEMNVRTAMDVYSLLNSGNKLRLLNRPGDHHGFDDVNSYFDWFDLHFGRLTNDFPLGWAGESQNNQLGVFAGNNFITPAGFDWEIWKKVALRTKSPAAKVVPPPPSAPLHKRIRWLLQVDSYSESRSWSPGSTYNEEQLPTFTYTSDMMRHIPFSSYNEDVERFPISFGNYITGNVYWNRHINTKLPQVAVIWLHPYSYSTGYMSVYKEKEIPFELAKKGYVVLAYDQIGMGMRVREGGTAFYARHGSSASLFGHMVSDVRSAVDFLICRGPVQSSRENNPLCATGEHSTPTYPAETGLDGIPVIDPQKIYLLGYSLGANVALHAAALDTRVAGVASFSGFTPLRADSNDRPTYGIKRLYDLHGLIPRLGFFKSNMSSIPYDYDELLSDAIAPRDTLLYTPMQDRDATFNDVSSCVEKASSGWNKGDKKGNYHKKDITKVGKLVHLAPNTFSCMRDNEVEVFLNWMANVSHLQLQL